MVAPADPIFADTPAAGPAAGPAVAGESHRPILAEYQ